VQGRQHQREIIALFMPLEPQEQGQGQKRAKEYHKPEDFHTQILWR